MSLRAFVPDDRIEKAPKLPTDRPATRAEVWAHFHAIYFDFKGHKPMPGCDDRCNHRNPGELEMFARDAWVWKYVERFIYAGRKPWDKQPDWKEGDPVIPGAVPDCRNGVPFESGNWSKIVEQVYALYQTAQAASIERSAA